jgi:putative membrane protein
MIRLILLFIYLLLVVTCLGFAALNANMVTLKLYWASFELPLAFVMVVCFGSGLVLGALLFIGKYLALIQSLRHSKNQVNILEKEIKNLRAIPIQDAH